MMQETIPPTATPTLEKNRKSVACPQGRRTVWWVYDVMPVWWMAMTATNMTPAQPVWLSGPHILTPSSDASGVIPSLREGASLGVAIVPKKTSAKHRYEMAAVQAAMM